jgi:cytosine/adenosine deaminase-related metal-dependent hydrolase
MRRFSADYIYTLDGDAIQNGVVVTDDNGKILAITDEGYASDPNIERFKGVIVPGFVNAHCHLELSHLLGVIPQKTGLIPFIKHVIKQRQESEDVILAAMKTADEQMWQNGIVAVGDISNQAISANIKETSKIKYHTFIEMLGFDKDHASDIFDKALNLQANFGTTSNSLTVHAPYSFSKDLLKKLRSYCKEHENKLSIHMQESEDENALYGYKQGAFLDFFKEFKINADYFKASAKTSIQTIVPILPKKQDVLLVHNTYTKLKDIFFVNRLNYQISWCFCPNANIYIENKVPTFEHFLQSNCAVTLGTDSLASNQQLCILSEMKVVKKHFENIELQLLLKWSCLNGAKFLGIDDTYGSITVGKKPGLNLLQNLTNNHITKHTTVKKLI